MEFIDGKGNGRDVRRRSTRQAQKNVVFAVDVKPRSSLKRSREVSKDAQSATVNGSKENDEESPSKLSRLQEAGDADGGNENGEEDTMVEADTADQSDHDQEMNSEDEGESGDVVIKRKPLFEEKSVTKTVRVGNLETEEMRTFLRIQRIQERPKTHRVVTSGPDIAHGSLCAGGDPPRTSSASAHPRPLENKPEILTVRSNIKQYQEKMKEKARDPCGAGIPSWDRHRPSEGPTTHIPQTSTIPAKKIPLQHRNAEIKKPMTTSTSSGIYSRGYAWYFCKFLGWALFLLTSLVLGLVGYQHLPVSSFHTHTQHQDSVVASANFQAQLAALKPLFPNQCSELWKRTEIHLKRHLNITDPTEPVSMILTSGLGAEKTLGCLAQKLAAAYSTALNASAVVIDGLSKTAQDSDQVKLEIDRALREAFGGGGKQAAVVHRFEELPPGSTLIFYRYCDHENAAYKNVFLAFTVLLPVDQLDSKLSLSAVEEKVQEYVKEKFVSSDRTATFNQMDVDKLSGLWSRISHLILPVAAEETIEQRGCGG